MTARMNMKPRIEELLLLVETLTGITIPDTDYGNLSRTVLERCEQTGTTPERYIEALHADGDERAWLVNRMMINETYFFREERHFSVLRDVVFPRLRARDGTTVFWSATCSTGEEAYSLAALAETHLEKPFIIHATDINGDSIGKAISARYGKNSFREDGSSYHHLVLAASAREGGDVVIGDTLRKRVAPGRANLYRDDTDSFPREVNVLFFRNTLIYMKHSVKQEILNRLAGRMAPGGYLFLGSSEMPLVVNPLLELEEHHGSFFFIRKDRQSHVLPPPRLPGEVPHARHRDTYTAPPRRAIDSLAVREAARGFFEDQGFGFSPDDPTHLMAELLHYALHFINSMKIGPATEIVSIMERIHADETVWHLKGFIALLKEEKDRSSRCFQKALELNPRFWPSRWYLASTMKRSSDDRATAEYGKCREQILRSLEGGDESFLFLLEGFSEKYFLEMCEQMITAPAGRS